MEKLSDQSELYIGTGRTLKGNIGSYLRREREKKVYKAKFNRRHRIMKKEDMRAV